MWCVSVWGICWFVWFEVCVVFVGWAWEGCVVCEMYVWCVVCVV